MYSLFFSFLSTFAYVLCFACIPSARCVCVCVSSKEVKAKVREQLAVHFFGPLIFSCTFFPRQFYPPFFRSHFFVTLLLIYSHFTCFYHCNVHYLLCLSLSLFTLSLLFSSREHTTRVHLCMHSTLLSMRYMTGQMTTGKSNHIAFSLPSPTSRGRQQISHDEEYNIGSKINFSRYNSFKSCISQSSMIYFTPISVQI